MEQEALEQMLKRTEEIIGLCNVQRIKRNLDLQQYWKVQERLAKVRAMELEDAATNVPSYISILNGKMTGKLHRKLFKV